MDARPVGDAPVARALVRVLGLGSEAHLRADTPLAAVGVDSLALLLVSDALAQAGWSLDDSAARGAVTLGDLVAACKPCELSA